MEVPHNPDNEQLEKDVDEMLRRRDLAYYAFMNMVLDSTHQE